MSSPSSEFAHPDRTLSSLGFCEDPISYPLAYPGMLPRSSGLLAEGCLFEMRHSGGWYVDVPAIDDADGSRFALDDVLKRLRQAPTDERLPVLAVGSNGSPAQVERKFRRWLSKAVVPMITVDVHGIIPGVSAHVSNSGYVPATSVLQSGEVSTLSVLLLDDEQISVMDSTEPNYSRALVPEDIVITAESGETLSGCQHYVSLHGCLVDRYGRSRRLIEQSSLLRELLDDSPRLVELIGANDASGFIARVRESREMRDQVRRLWRDEGAVLAQPELAGQTNESR